MSALAMAFAVGIYFACVLTRWDKWLPIMLCVLLSGGFGMIAFNFYTQLT